MKLKVIIPCVVVALVAALAFAFWNKSQKTAALISNAVPDIPGAISHPELAKRIAAADKSARQGPERLQGLAELSRLYHANGYTNEAWKCYAALVLVDPSEPRWPYRFGRILAGYGQLEEAVPYFRKAAQLDADYPPARIRLADTLLKLNEFEDAQEIYQATLKDLPDNAYAMVGLARIAISRDDWEGARAHLEKAVQVSDYQIGADLLGDVYERLGLRANEREVLSAIQWGSYADIPDPWSLILMEDCYDAYQVSIAGGWVAHQGDIRTGLRYIKRAVELEPENATLRYQIAGIYLNLNETEQAREEFETCVELQPDFADAWLNLIDLAKNKQSPTLVRRTLERAMQFAPDSPSLQIEKGEILLAQRRFDEAISHFQRSIELRPHEAVGYIELAQAYITANRISEGIEQMRIALQKEPNHPVAMSTLAYDAIARSDQKEADEWFRRMANQPRLTAKELSPLRQMYQQKFQSLPPY